LCSDRVNPRAALSLVQKPRNDSFSAALHSSDRDDCADDDGPLTPNWRRSAVEVRRATLLANSKYHARDDQRKDDPDQHQRPNQQHDCVRAHDPSPFTATCRQSTGSQVKAASNFDGSV
jgi:hypothetical protein